MFKYRYSFLCVLFFFGLFFANCSSVKALSTSNDASFDNIDITTKSTFFKSNKNDYLRNNLVINDPVKDMGVGYTVTLSYCVSSVTDISSLTMDFSFVNTTMATNGKYSFKGPNSCTRKGSGDPGVLMEIIYNVIPAIPLGDNELDSVTKYKSDIWIDFNYHENTLGSTKEINFVSYKVDTIPISVIQNNKQEEANETSKGIWGTIKDIFSKITNLPGLIWNAIKGGFEAITSALVSLGTFILDGLKSLFIPSEAELSQSLDNLKNAMNSKLGAIGQIVTSFTDFIFGINWNNSQGTIRFPGIKVLEYTIVEAQDVRIIPEGFSFLQDTLKLIIDIVITIAFVNMLYSKYRGFVGGNSSDY